MYDKGPRQCSEGA